MENKDRTDKSYSIRVFRSLYFPNEQEIEARDIQLLYTFEGRQVGIGLRTIPGQLETIEIN